MKLRNDLFIKNDKRLSRVWAGLALGLLACGMAHAQWTPTVELTESGDTAVLSINRRPAIKFENVNAPWTLPGRPMLVAQRLAALIEKGFNPKWIQVKDTPQGALILAGGSPLLTVSDSEAKAKGMTRQALANAWASSLRQLLMAEPLTVSPKQVTVPVGQNRVVEVRGLLTGPVNFAIEPQGLATATLDPQTRKIALFGTATGSGKLTVAVENETVTVPFSVKKYAGRAQDAFVAVTGKGPDRATLRQVVESAVERNIIAEPGAKAKFDESAITLPSSIPAQGAVIKVPVKIEGPDYLPVSTTASVRVVREEVGRTEPDYLYYSNDPEMLRQYYGVVYNGVIRRGKAVRLLYHHQSAMPAPIRFMVQLKNGDAPTRLQIINGAADPQVDTYQIGHRAAAKFFPQWLSDSGYVQELAPGETLTLVNQRLGKDMTSSGIYHFVLLSGADVQVQIRAEPPDLAPTVRNAPLNPEVYPVTRKSFNETYSVGGRWSFFSFGREPVKAANEKHPLLGNYGVIYDIEVNLENPTDQRNAADIVFDPAAGVARGVFIVDGKMIETNHLRPPQEFVIGSYPLAPGERKKVRILTMPLAGSNYPARITVRPRHTVAQNNPE